MQNSVQHTNPPITDTRWRCKETHIVSTFYINTLIKVRML